MGGKPKSNGAHALRKDGRMTKTGLSRSLENSVSTFFQLIVLRALFRNGNRHCNSLESANGLELRDVGDEGLQSGIAVRD